MSDNIVRHAGHIEVAAGKNLIEKIATRTTSFPETTPFLTDAAALNALAKHRALALTNQRELSAPVGRF